MYEQIKQHKKEIVKSRICDTPQQGSTEFLKKKKKQTRNYSLGETLWDQVDF